MQERPKRKVVFCRVCCFVTTHELVERYDPSMSGTPAKHWLCVLCKTAEGKDRTHARV